jgi:hypothetical protein
MKEVNAVTNLMTVFKYSASFNKWVSNYITYMQKTDF